jgi:hypothetical protein
MLCWREKSNYLMLFAEISRLKDSNCLNKADCSDIENFLVKCMSTLQSFQYEPHLPSDAGVSVQEGHLCDIYIH